MTPPTPAEDRPEHHCCSGCDSTGHCTHGYEDPRAIEKERLAQALRDGDDATFVAAVRAANDPAALSAPSEPAGLREADALIRKNEPPTYSTDEFKAGWHQAISRSLTAVARARNQTDAALAATPSQPARAKLDEAGRDDG